MVGEEEKRRRGVLGVQTRGSREGRRKDGWMKKRSGRMEETDSVS